MSESLIEVLMRRDDMTREEALEWIMEGVDMVNEGEDPEEVLFSEFGLEPDYVIDFIGYMS